MTQGKPEIIIASLPDRDQVVAEIWFEDDQFAELRHENDSLVFEIYSRPGNNGPWDIRFDELLEVLNAAKVRLMGTPPEAAEGSGS